MPFSFPGQIDKILNANIVFTPSKKIYFFLSVFENLSLFVIDKLQIYKHGYWGNIVKLIAHKLLAQ
jgi:hypothetical protein